jgi:hypothetical protein
MLDVIYLMTFTFDMTLFLCCNGIVYMPSDLRLHWVTWAPLWTMHFAWTWLGYEPCSFGGLSRGHIAHFIKDVPLIMEDVGFSFRMSHFVRWPSTLGEDVTPFLGDIAPFGDKFTLGWWNIAPFGGGSLWSPYTYLFTPFEWVIHLWRPHVPHEWLWACIYGGCLTFLSILPHLGSIIGGLLTYPLLYHGKGNFIFS